jgi:tight adherence protein B
VSVLLAAAFAAAAAALLVALPQPGQLRFEDLHREPGAARVSRSGGVAVLPRRLALLPAVPLAFALGPVLAGLAVVGLVLAQRSLRLRIARRTAAGERSRAVEACGTLAAELRAGRDPGQALAAAAEVAAGPSAATLAAAAAAARLGGDVPAALMAAGDSAVEAVLRALAACWTVCAASGSGLAAAVERLEEGLRAEQAQRRAVDAELAGPRATAGLLAVLPAAGLLLAAGLGADPLHVLLATPLGLVCLVLGLGLDALGVLWTGRLVARAGGTG